MVPGRRRWTTAFVRDMGALTDVQLEVCGTARCGKQGVRVRASKGV